MRLEGLGHKVVAAVLVLATAVAAVVVRLILEKLGRQPALEQGGMEPHLVLLVQVLPEQVEVGAVNLLPEQAAPEVMEVVVQVLVVLLRLLLRELLTLVVEVVVVLNLRRFPQEPTAVQAWSSLKLPIP